MSENRGADQPLNRAERYAANRAEERAYQRAYYARNRDRLRAQARENKRKRSEDVRVYGRAWALQDRHKNPERYLIVSAKARAKRRGMPFELTIADITIPDVCPVLGIPIALSRGLSAGSPSIDRINNALGYVPGNVRVISHRANALKRDMTYAEALLLVQNWGAK